MNKEQHAELRKQVPGFDQKHTQMVDTSNIIFDKKCSQKRKTGHVVRRVPEFTQKHLDGVAFPPISIRWLPNGEAEMKDGATRVLARMVAEQQAKGFTQILVSDYHDQVLKYGPDDWEDFQYIGNDHEWGTPNSDADIEKCISDQVQGGQLDKKLGFKYKNNEKQYIKDGAIHYKTVIFKNAGRNATWFQNRIKKALKGTTAQSFENYIKDQGFQFYCNQTGFLGTEVGEVCNNQTVYTFCNPSHKSPNIVGNTFTKRMKNPSVKVDLVYWVGNLTGKTNDEIVAERNHVTKWFDGVVAAHPDFFNALSFLPQIKISCANHKAEGMYSLIQVR